MADLTVTEMRKDLFRIVDEMIETGRPLRLRRGPIIVELVPRVVDDESGPKTPQERWARFLQKPEREALASVDFEVLEYGDHWEWRVQKDLT